MSSINKTDENNSQLLKECHQMLKDLETNTPQIDANRFRLYTKMKPLDNPNHKFFYESMALKIVRIESDKKKYILLGHHGCQFLTALNFERFETAIEKKTQELIDKYKEKEKKNSLNDNKDYADLIQKLDALKKEKEEKSQELIKFIASLSSEENVSADSPRGRKLSFSSNNAENKKIDQALAKLSKKIDDTQDLIKQKATSFINEITPLINERILWVKDTKTSSFSIDAAEEVFLKACEENTALRELLLATGKAYISNLNIQKYNNQVNDNDWYDSLDSKNEGANLWGKTLMKVRLFYSGLGLTGYAIPNSFFKPEELKNFCDSLNK